MSPSTRDSTDSRLILRTAAMFPRPEVRHDASAASRSSAGVGAASPPTSTAGWSASMANVLSCCCSAPTPKNVLIWFRLCVPEIQRLSTLNRNRAASGCALTASSVANSLAVSTPLRRDCAATVLTVTPPEDSRT